MESEQKVDKRGTLRKQMSSALINFGSAKTRKSEQSEDSSVNPDHKKEGIIWAIRNNHTLDLIRLRKEEDAIRLALKKKKEEFADRMEVCAAKKLKLTKRRQEFDEHVEIFRPILEESEIRRFKALQKTKAENKEISSKDKQLKELKEEVDNNTEKIGEAQSKIEKYNPLLSFLDQVQGQMPEGYLDDNVPVCEALRKRYRALKHANEDLRERNNSMIAELTELQTEKTEQQTKHDSQVMILTSQVAQQKRHLDQMVQVNITKEEELDKVMRTQQLKHQTVHTILTAIDNISRLCKDPTLPVPKQSRRKLMLDIKLRQIQEFIVQRNLVVDHALQQVSQSSRLRLASTNSSLVSREHLQRESTTMGYRV